MIKLEIGNWSSQSTWHIVYKDTLLPLCKFEGHENGLPLHQHISAIPNVPLCRKCTAEYVRYTEMILADILADLDAEIKDAV